MKISLSAKTTLRDADARGNIDDLIETFGTDYLAGLGQEFLMFLDVEGSPPSNPSFSADYYAGWA
jgi:hypothetical protein